MSFPTAMCTVPFVVYLPAFDLQWLEGGGFFSLSGLLRPSVTVPHQVNGEHLPAPVATSRGCRRVSEPREHHCASRTLPGLTCTMEG